MKRLLLVIVNHTPTLNVFASTKTLFQFTIIHELTPFTVPSIVSRASAVANIAVKPFRYAHAIVLTRERTAGIVCMWGRLKNTIRV